LATGGRAVGATSTRSRSDSWASRSASFRATIPTCSPFGPTSRTSGTLMRSLIRGSTLMWPPWAFSPPASPGRLPRPSRGSWLRAGYPDTRKAPHGMHAEPPNRRRRDKPAARAPRVPARLVRPTRRPGAGQVGGGPPLARPAPAGAGLVVSQD